MPSSFIAVGGNSPYATIQEGIEAAEMGGISTIVVAAGSYTENNTLSGAAADGLTIQAASGDAVTLHGSFSVEGASNVTISGLTFQGDGTNVAVSATGSDHLTITGNTFNGTGQAIVLTGTTNSTISNNLITNTALSAIEERDGSSYDTITNNIIDGDAGDASSPTKGAIWLHGASNGEISHNQISNVNNAGISLSDFETGTLTQNNNTVVEYNALNNVVANTADNGAIYVLGRSQNPQTGIIIRSNDIGAVGSTTVANPHAVGLYLDDNASGVTVTGNIVQASAGLTDPFELHGGSNDTISGKIFDLGTGSADFGLLQSDTSDQQPRGTFQQLTNDAITGNIYVTASTMPHNPGFADLTDGHGSGITITDNDFYSYSGASLNVAGAGATGDTSAKYVAPAPTPAQSSSDYSNFTAASVGFTPIDTSVIGLDQPGAVGAPCYCPGTLVATSSGEVAVETLRIGDAVLIEDGTEERVRWIGRRSYDGRFISGNHLMLPVTIGANALADGVPHTDLVVSPGHALWIDRHLIPAWRLVNGASITQAGAVDSVTYIHVELRRHAVICANGAAAESYVETEGFRGQFHNAREFHVLYPRTPAPRAFQARLESGFELQRIQERLAERAGLFADVQPIGALRGYVDVAGPNRVCGWAQDVDSPEEPVVLEIRVADRVIQHVLANGWRADLRRAGLGSGCHAFDVLLPDDVNGPVVVRRVADSAPLSLAYERRTA